MNPKKIGVFPAEEFPHYRRTLEALGQLFGVCFLAGEESALHFYEAILFLRIPLEAEVEVATCGLPCLALVTGPAKPASPSSAKVVFGESPHLRRYFRGRRLPDKSIDKISKLEREPGDEVLAQMGDENLWIHRSKNGCSLHMVAAELPQLPMANTCFSIFSRIIGRAFCRFSISCGKCRVGNHHQFALASCSMIPICIGKRTAM